MLLHALVMHAFGKNHPTTDAKKSIDELMHGLVNKIFDRALDPWPHPHTGFDSATLGKVPLGSPDNLFQAVDFSTAVNEPRQPIVSSPTVEFFSVLKHSRVTAEKAAEAAEKAVFAAEKAALAAEKATVAAEETGVYWTPVKRKANMVAAAVEQAVKMRMPAEAEAREIAFDAQPEEDAFDVKPEQSEAKLDIADELSDAEEWWNSHDSLAAQWSPEKAGDIELQLGLHLWDPKVAELHQGSVQKRWLANIGIENFGWVDRSHFAPKATSRGA